MAGRGLILSAPASGSGKTTITLGLLRALRRAGHAVRGAKSGPDYIDPCFHEAASAQPCTNLDAWAMSDAQIRGLAAGEGLLVVEGAMGLFDGAPPDNRGATADLARCLSIPVILVVDAGQMSGSVAALVDGFARFDPAVQIAGVILNKVGSARHERALRRALAPLNIPVLGAVPRQSALVLEDRHLGLVQASEHNDLDGFLERAADAMVASVDLAALLQTAASLPDAHIAPTAPISAARVAIARDQAFAFLYPHMIRAWQAAGTQIAWFSPLKDMPVPDADLVFLPGGYPELHAARLAAASTFHESLREAAERCAVYGECGGYMVLGETLVDAKGTPHAMAGLLPLETSFAVRKRHLGYRHLVSDTAPVQGSFAGHEFHYASTVRADGPPLFEAQDAEGQTLDPMGLCAGRVCGSFAHIIERCPAVA